jgi:hypothetical protein
MEVHRSVEVLQSMAAEGEQLFPVEKARGRIRKERLPAVRECADARSAVHVDADITLLAERWCPRVQTGADADWPGGERLVAGARSSRGALRCREGDEEGVALRIHLDAAVRGEGLPQRLPMLAERLGVRVRAERVQQPRRALHVGEEECDRAGRELGAHLFESTTSARVAQGRRRCGRFSAVAAALPPRRRPDGRRGTRPR